jgi:hypothetical protein
MTMARKPLSPRIAEGALTVALAGGVGEAAQERAKRLEKAMSAAVMKAHDEGVRDPDQIRERIIAARDKFLADEAKALELLQQQQQKA